MFLHYVYYPQNGVSSLLLAAAGGHVDVMESLLQHRATVDLKKTVSAKIYFFTFTISVITY